MPQCIPVSERHEHPDPLARWPFLLLVDCLDKWDVPFESCPLLFYVSWMKLDGGRLGGGF